VVRADPSFRDAGPDSPIRYNGTQAFEDTEETNVGGWEYVTLDIRYDKKEHKNWVVKYAEASPLVGLQAILTAYGSRGWELVSLRPERYDALPAFGRWELEPASYRATFKRSVPDGA
jgi:hypothetical protein